MHRENPSQSDLFRFVKSCHTLKQQTLECTNLQKQTQTQRCAGWSRHKVPGLVVLAFFPSCERVLQETWSSSIIHSNTGPLQHSPLALLETSGLTPLMCCLSGTLDSQHYGEATIYNDYKTSNGKIKLMHLLQVDCVLFSLEFRENILNWVILIYEFALPH